MEHRAGSSGDETQGTADICRRTAPLREDYANPMGVDGVLPFAAVRAADAGEGLRAS